MALKKIKSLEEEIPSSKRRPSKENLGLTPVLATLLWSGLHLLFRRPGLAMMFFLPVHQR
ncbi:hypothetical protein NQZ68_015579 [Dissostichus eleginoides]|nr:hypothetical protein NQZ68_015579 [Dissostichus eleginoides]